MALFKQEYKLKFSNPNNVIEKVTIKDVKKGKIRLYIPSGYSAFIPTIEGGISYPGNKSYYEFGRDDFVQSKHEDCDVFLYKENDERKVVVPFFGGKYTINLSVAKGVKGTFTLVGTAYLDINNPEALIRSYNKTLTIEDIQDDIAENGLKDMLTNEITSIANSQIGLDANENTLASSVRNIIEEMVDESKQATSVFKKIGLRISKRGTSMHVNALEDAKKYADLINSKILDSNLYDLEGGKRKDENEREDKGRQFEIDKIKAERAEISDRTTTINKTINANGDAAKEALHEEERRPSEGVRYCPYCGAKIENKAARFCMSCGNKLD